MMWLLIQYMWTSILHVYFPFYQFIHRWFSLHILHFYLFLYSNYINRKNEKKKSIHKSKYDTLENIILRIKRKSQLKTRQKAVVSTRSLKWYEPPSFSDEYLSCQTSRPLSITQYVSSYIKFEISSVTIK